MSPLGRSEGGDAEESAVKGRKHVRKGGGPQLMSYQHGRRKIVWKHTVWCQQGANSTVHSSGVREAAGLMVHCRSLTYRESQ